MTKGIKEFNSEDRLGDFADRIICAAESLPKTKAWNHITGQLIRCGSAPTPNYGEGQGVDFVASAKIAKQNESKNS